MGGSGPPANRPALDPTATEIREEPELLVVNVREGQLRVLRLGEDANQAYTYDRAGNRTGGEYLTAADNRMTQDAAYTYAYDHEGRRTSRTDRQTGAFEEYHWDHRGRLTGVATYTDAALTTRTQAVSFEYDLLDRRIAKKVDGDGDAPSQRRNSAGCWRTRNTPSGATRDCRAIRVRCCT